MTLCRISPLAFANGMVNSTMVPSSLLSEVLSALNGKPGEVNESDRQHKLPLRIQESATEYTIVAEAPGATKENIEIEVKGKSLSISIQWPSVPEHGKDEDGQLAAEPGQNHILRNELPLRTGTYSRTIPLGSASESVTAEFRDGLLTVIVTKQSDAPSMKITIN